jgi:hypothetical protein
MTNVMPLRQRLANPVPADRMGETDALAALQEVYRLAIPRELSPEFCDALEHLFEETWNLQVALEIEHERFCGAQITREQYEELQQHLAQTYEGDIA